jgi:iron(III) transport system substrate-binding protein
MASILLAACAPAATPVVIRETVEVTRISEVEVEATVEVPVEAPAEPGRLVLYSGRSESLVAPIIEQFSQVTGVEVEVRYGSTSEVATALLEEGGNSPADVFWAQDPGGLGAVADAGLLATLPPETLSQAPAEFQSPEGQWVGISGRARVVVYNTESLTPEDLPDDLSGFTDPQWNGRIGWAPTNASLQTMITAMRQVWGEAETRQWLEGIQANNPVAYEGNTQVVAGVAAGEVEVGFVNHYYLYRFLAEEGEGFQARNHFLSSGGPGSLVMVAGVGRLAAGANEANALKFIDFLLSPVAQQFFATQTFEYPMVDGVSTHRDLTPLKELTAIALDIDLADLADLQGTAAMMNELGILE